MFIEKQSPEQREKYIQLLAGVGGLSRLFSDSDVPYLYYRAHENIFCLSLDANNESRGDVAVDAIKDGVGIGLKTFIGKGTQYEKVAEFNKLSSSYRTLSEKELASFISEARNERINLTKRAYDLDSSIYHCVTRVPGKFKIFETSMDLVDIDSIKITRASDNILDFSDGKNDYKFNSTKSTLFKKFKADKTLDFDVAILDDPYSLILGLNGKSLIEEISEDIEVDSTVDSVILPLYSTRGGIHVHERSGLNQWNAEGRARHEDEVYIPVPVWIHRRFPDFFPPRDVPFNLSLPGGQSMSAKICQSDGKALMSNPNKELGEWLLRKVLKLKPGELLTYDYLIKVGIDSVEVSKDSSGNYSIDFKKVGSFDSFAEDNKLV